MKRFIQINSACFDVNSCAVDTAEEVPANIVNNVRGTRYFKPRQKGFTFRLIKSKLNKKIIKHFCV